MTTTDSATGTASPPLRATRSGWLWGGTGVLAFSLTVPLTRVAVGGLPPLVVGAGRAVLAALAAAVLLALLRAPRPARRHLPGLAVVAGGVVVGFPVLTSLALQRVSAAHAALVIAVLPAATAVAAVLRGRERPAPVFWVAAGAGALAVAATTLLLGPAGPPSAADLLLVGAVVAAAAGYAEGARTARELGAWQTICWALLLGLPVTAPVAAVAWVAGGGAPAGAGAGAWLAFAYLGLVSSLAGFFAWYRGLAIGPVTSVSQTQLVQPVLTVLWSALLLGEALTPAVVLGCAAVVAAAAWAVRARVARP
ncbi:DMT family transporter [Kineococcus terrestris]|uniref:DMT family transporter n=1 Tax=Kineococcus terrestris TaxID=2044856 RepID=UPI0034DB3C32